MPAQTTGCVARLVSTTVAIADASGRDVTGFCWAGARGTFFSLIRKAILGLRERLASFRV